MIRNSNSEEVTAFVVHARPEPKMNESSSNLLNGGWHIQTIGVPAEILKVKLSCKWTVVQELMTYYTTKEILYIDYLDFEKRGHILNLPTYDLGEADETDPTYIMTFEMAVVPNV